MNTNMMNTPRLLGACMAAGLLLAGLTQAHAATRTYELVGTTTAGGAQLSGGFTYNDVTHLVETVNISTTADPAAGLVADTFDLVAGLLTYGPEHQMVAVSTTSSPSNAIVLNFGAFLGTQPEYVFTQAPSPGGITYIYVSASSSYLIVNGKAVEVLPVVDTDGDGHPDDADAFPNDPTEWADTDGDGVGDNGDAFPLDPTESVDTDGDGVGDNADACDTSDLSLTVVIDGTDTFVFNELFDDGCTITDLIVDLAASAGNHGAFVSGVAHLTNDLKGQGVITNKEKAVIQKAAAQSSW
ncbi:MAG: hypothetical protein KDL09_08905 [Prosthecobacter sp.]|nr:hypothetical protein [Prosthecobacter sp.]MCB1276686.1 hypothetical protein [Prosthecobacter sp.]